MCARSDTRARPGASSGAGPRSSRGTRRAAFARTALRDPARARSSAGRYVARPRMCWPRTVSAALSALSYTTAMTLWVPRSMPTASTAVSRTSPSRSSTARSRVLASEADSSYISGIVLPVLGGETIGGGSRLARRACTRKPDRDTIAHRRDARNITRSAFSLRTRASAASRTSVNLMPPSAGEPRVTVRDERRRWWLSRGRQRSQDR